MKCIQLQILLLLCLTAASAQEENFLPARYPIDRYTTDWENSPFNREVVKAVAEGVASAFGRGIILEGVVIDDQAGSIAYVKNLEDGLLMVITENASTDHPFTIKSTSQANDPRETSVTITDGKEQAEIRYEVDSLTRSISTTSAPADPADPPNPAMLGGEIPLSGATETVVPAGEKPASPSPPRRRILLPSR